MMYIKSFISELSKKIDTVQEQLKDFESKIESINQVKNILTSKTLKNISDLVGEDLVMLSKEDFALILEIFNFDQKEDKMKIFFNASVSLKVYQKIVSDKEIEYKNKEEVISSIKWLDEQVNIIKEYINDFNNNNKEYYNSLKLSDSLYRKYIEYFKNDKLVKPIYDIEEFNEVIKKSGIITSDKWQLLKYVGEKNIELYKKGNFNKKETIEYSDDEIISFVESILRREQELINSINEEMINTSLNMFEYDDEKIKSLNLTEEEVVKYQKVPIIDAMNKMYIETKEMLVKDENKDAIKIENNLKDLLKLVDSYDIVKKIES